MPSIRRRGVSGLVLVASAMVSPAIADAAHGSGGRPLLKRQHFVDYLAPDDFFIDLCGIVTNTTVRELDILKTWPDGSQSFRVERSFHPRGPTAAHRARRGNLVLRARRHDACGQGKPIQLIGPDGGVRALDAGQTLLGDPTVLHGHHDVGINNEDLAPFYCPPSGS